MGVRRCLARSLTSLALLRTPKSANGPRSNSFRPDSPSTTNLPTGTEDSAIPLTTPDMVRSGRVLQTSVKSNLYSKLDDFPVVGYEKPSVVKLFSFTCIELFASGNVFILRMPENKGRNMETLGKLTGLFHCAVMLFIGIKTLPVTI